MTGPEFRAIRKHLGLTLYAWGRALGYSGNRNTIQCAVQRYEKGERDIPPWIAKLAEMYERHGIPE